MSEAHADAVVRRVRFDPTRPRGADAYDRAFRHSRRVSILKVALPAIAGVALAGFFLTMRFADITGTTAVATSGLNVDTKTLVMDAPHMSGYDSNHHPYTVKATKAIQDLVNPQIVNLETIDAHFATDEVNTAVLKARAGVLNNGKNLLRLDKGVTIVTTDGYHANLVDADIDIGKGRLVSGKPIEIHSSDGNWLKANGVTIENKGAKLTFVGGVSVNYIPADHDAAAAAPAAGPAAGVGGAPAAGAPAVRRKRATP
jgi:lipopolysaccharide export system protein LptC